MKFKLVLLLCTFFLTTAFTSDKPLKVILFGDSITQAGVREGGYITLMQKMLQKTGKSADYELIGEGIGGNKIYDLYLRAEEDVLAQNPDVVVIWVGVNDVWHKVTHGTGTDADKFEQFYRALIKRFQDKGIKVIVCTPATIGEKTDFSNQQDGDLNQYANIIRKISDSMNTGLLDLREIFLAYNRENNPENSDRGILTTDRVHLNEKG
ncbi:MAG: GDSL-type esterase/lipase family protein, partial [Spirosomaceae bacterium]|nr:GDSL-type esterase/lipase family protein [Spirosomataceae bacterium]